VVLIAPLVLGTLLAIWLFPGYIWLGLATLGLGTLATVLLFWSARATAGLLLGGTVAGLGCIWTGVAAMGSDDLGLNAFFLTSNLFGVAGLCVLFLAVGIHGHRKPPAGDDSA